MSAAEGMETLLPPASPPPPLVQGSLEGSPGAEVEEVAFSTGEPQTPAPSADDFLARIRRGSKLGGSCQDAGDEDGHGDVTDSSRARLTAAIAAEELRDTSAGTDEVARVLAYYCRHHGGDARTLRTVAEPMMLLRPPMSPVDLLLCLMAFMPRFAPVALLSEAGRALVQLCHLFEQLLLFHDPEVAFLLRRAKIGAEVYCAPWLLTAHAAGLADPEAVLHVWDGWLDSGESLDPVFLGLARLMLCHDELVLCGPVPELAQLLHASLGGQRHARTRVVDVALRRAAELKALTPLSFLRRLQDALLRPPPEVAAAPASGPVPESASGSVVNTPGGLAQRAAAWLPLRRAIGAGGGPVMGPSAATGPHAPAPQPLVCMRVEPQDVLMAETIKERHLRKVGDEPAIHDESGCSVNSSAAERGPRSVPAAVDSGCRLLPKLVDVRPLAEAKNNAVKPSVGVDVADPHGLAEFIKWVRRREQEVGNFGLRPLHVLMTTDGSLNSDQQRFVKGILEEGLAGVCILGGGYGSLAPFFLGGQSGEQRQLVERAQEAKELVHKSIGGLQTLWRKAPSRQQLLGFAPLPPQQRLAKVGASPATFDRAPVPPALHTPSGTSGAGVAELMEEQNSPAVIGDAIGY